MALLLVVPLLMALLFAPETLRWRDLGYSCLALAVVFFPYLLWELVTKFSDIAIIRSILEAQTCLAPLRGLPAAQSQAGALFALQPLRWGLLARAAVDHDGTPIDRGGAGVLPGKAGSPPLAHIALFGGGNLSCYSHLCWVSR